MMKNTPRKASILAVLTVMSSVLSFVGGMALLMGAAVGGAFGATGSGIALTLGAAMFAVGLVGFMVGYGFWTSHAWARTGAVVVYGTGAAVHVASVVLAGASILSIMMPVAIAAVVIWYLFQPATEGKTVRQPA